MPKVKAGQPLSDRNERRMEHERRSGDIQDVPTSEQWWVTTALRAELGKDSSEMVVGRRKSKGRGKRLADPADGAWRLNEWNGMLCCPLLGQVTARSASRTFAWHCSYARIRASKQCDKGRGLHPGPICARCGEPLDRWGGVAPLRPCGVACNVPAEDGSGRYGMPPADARPRLQRAIHIRAR